LEIWGQKEGGGVNQGFPKILGTSTFLTGRITFGRAVNWKAFLGKKEVIFLNFRIKELLPNWDYHFSIIRGLQPGLGGRN